jgi:hypothetical protein
MPRGGAYFTERVPLPQRGDHSFQPSHNPSTLSTQKKPLQKSLKKSFPTP